jgi:hydroxypyruvate reductase
MTLQPRPSVLFAAPIPVGLRESISPLITVAGSAGGSLAADLSAEDAASIRALVTFGTLKTDAVLMDRLPNLDLICCFGSGYEGIDIDEAVKRGITVTYSPAVNAAAVADLAMGLLLAANRHIVAADKFVRAGFWSGHATARMPVVRGLTGRKIGIFGLGAIGAKIAARAAAFEMEIAYHNRSRKLDAPYIFHETLQSLANWADILMIAARADASNHHAVSSEIMRALGPSGILVNISRGSIVDEQAMISLLQSGDLGSVGLDVYEDEPNVPEALKALSHVVLAPHIGGATLEAIGAMQSLVVENIKAFFSGQPADTPIPETTR